MVALSALLVRALIRRFHAAGIVDAVGHRSSHALPTPRGGGLGFVLAATVAWVAAPFCLQDVSLATMVGVVGAGAAVAAVGLLDDLRGVPAVVRLMVHLAAAALGLCSVSLCTISPALGAMQWASMVALVVAAAWFVNAFNFMDGTDAFAASHGVGVSVLVATLLVLDGADAMSSRACALALACGIVAALIGFLPFNWPRARIFMGDVGSGWLGLSVAMMLAATYQAQSHASLAGLALLSPFLMDPTVCLARRAIRGERVWQAHRAHAFQNLSRQLGSHARLLAWWWAATIVVYLPLAVLTWRAGCWPWLPLALALGVMQAMLLRSGVPGVAER